MNVLSIILGLGNGTSRTINLLCSAVTYTGRHKVFKMK